jgi:hypothetical protein
MDLEFGADFAGPVVGTMHAWLGRDDIADMDGSFIEGVPKYGCDGFSAMSNE